jgi:hypothetical protein
MNNLDLSRPLARLESEALEEQAAALDEATTIMKEFGRKLVNRFIQTDSDNRFIIWDRFLRFSPGPFVIDPPKGVLLQAEDPELRAYAASALLILGNRTCVPILLEIISSDKVFLCLAANQLAEAHIAEAGDRMIERLRSLEFTKKNHILGIQCLFVGPAGKKMGRSLPPNLAERFQSAEAPWEIRIYLKKPST